jgi:hypothetical protein
MLLHRHQRPAPAAALCTRRRLVAAAGLRRPVEREHAALADGLETPGDYFGHVGVVEQRELDGSLGQEEVAG